MAHCMISDEEHCYCLRHGGKESGLEKAPLDGAGDPDWDHSQPVDFLRLAPREELYLRTIVGMLIALEWMQKER